MPRTILLAASFATAPDRLYDMYLDAKAHAAFTGSPAVIEPKPGTSFSAFDGLLTGKTLHVEPKRLIVQVWRSSNWPATAISSTLTLAFWPELAGARIELVHANVPDEDYAGVSRGWERYYWAPWRAYLSEETRT